MSVHIIEVAWRFRTRSNHHHKEGVTNTTKTTAKTEVWLVPDSCGGCFPFLAMMEKVIFAFECSLFQSQFWRFLCFVGATANVLYSSLPLPLFLCGLLCSLHRPSSPSSSSSSSCAVCCCFCSCSWVSPPSHTHHTKPSAMILLEVENRILAEVISSRVEEPEVCSKLRRGVHLFWFFGFFFFWFFFFFYYYFLAFLPCVPSVALLPSFFLFFLCLTVFETDDTNPHLCSRWTDPIG